MTQWITNLAFVQGLETVTHVDALHDEGLVAGTVGTIVHAFERPNRAFAVEVTDDDGGTVAFVTLLAAAHARGDRRAAGHTATTAPTPKPMITIGGIPRLRRGRRIRDCRPGGRLAVSGAMR